MISDCRSAISISERRERNPGDQQNWVPAPPLSRRTSFAGTMAAIDPGSMAGTTHIASFVPNPGSASFPRRRESRFFLCGMASGEITSAAKKIRDVIFSQNEPEKLFIINETP
jgi:hypothetical protein